MPKFLCDSSRHLICVPYSVAGLHAMAKELGIKRCWFHNGRFPHYDIPVGRIDDIKSKAEVVSAREIMLTISRAMGRAPGTGQIEAFPKDQSPARQPALTNENLEFQLTLNKNPDAK